MAATKQKRKTARRKKKQADARQREKMIFQAMGCVGGPSTRQAAERMSNEVLAFTIKTKRRANARMTSSAMEMIISKMLEETPAERAQRMMLGWTGR